MISRAVRVAFAACAIPTLAQAAGIPQATRTGDAADSYFGVTIKDPYRWMEAQGPDFLAWADGQNRVTRSTLDALPGYVPLAHEVAKAGDAVTAVAGPQRRGAMLYFERRAPGEDQPSLYVRPLAGGAPRKLVDPVTFGGTTMAISEYEVSPDNRRLAFTLSSGGSEEAVMHLMDIGTRTLMPETIDRARLADPRWAPDGSVVFYTRLKEKFSGPDDRFADQVTFRHTPGEDPSKDVPVFTAAGSETGPKAFIGIFTPPGSRYALAFANSGVSREAEWFAAPLASVMPGGKPAWTRIASLADKVVLTIDGDVNLPPVVRGSLAWFPCLKGADTVSVVTIDLAHPGAAPNMVVPPQSAPLSNMAIASDGAYLSYAEGGHFRLRRAAFDGGGLTDIALPYDGAIDEMTADPEEPGLAAILTSWARPRTIFGSSGGRLEDLGLAPAMAMDLSGIVSDTIIARATDGTGIPVSVIHLRDLKRDGSAPALVEAYGAYGISENPSFRAQLTPFLLHGGVWAYAHVRGGGEFGEAWHLAGKGSTKPNTWRDFIASVHALEVAGFTSRTHVVGFGASAGGIMIGRAITEAPDLLAGAVIWAPISNTLRFETTEGGPANTAEFGSVATRAGFDALREMDAYSHVVDGTNYPAVLVTIGLNDHRVPPWMGAEFAARLQAATRSGKPVLLRVDAKGGHHMIGVSRDDFDSQVTDLLAFVLMQTGDAAFRPR